MSTTKALLPLSLVAMLAACVAKAPAPEQPEPVFAGIADAVLVDAAGAPRGDALITQLDQGLRLLIRVEGVPPGVHAVHIHTIGRCEAPDFRSAGGHWNPAGREHGRDNPRGQHRGDMPNLIVGQNGTGLVEVTITGGHIEGGPQSLLDADGSAIMLHARPDDYRSDPAGAAGPRIACGIIEPRR
jgi:Cu-Zn family superoxide dismutase